MTGQAKESTSTSAEAKDATSRYSAPAHSRAKYPNEPEGSACAATAWRKSGARPETACRKSLGGVGWSGDETASPPV